MVTNTDVAVVQRGVLWASGANYAVPIEPAVSEHHVGQGDYVTIAIQATVPIATDVLDFLRDQHIPVAQLVLLSPTGGPRDNSVGSPEDAWALAYDIRQAARNAARGYAHVHLFLAGPMGLSLLLGHRWNRVGPTTVYEDIAAMGYEPAFTVSA